MCALILKRQILSPILKGLLEDFLWPLLLKLLDLKALLCSGMMLYGTAVAPCRISIFLWRVFHNALAVGANIQRRGIQMAVHCYCCNGLCQLETIEHLFLNSQIARHIWGSFSHYMGWHCDFSSLHSFMNSCIGSAIFSAERNFTSIVTIAIGLWVIWQYRKKKCYGDSYILLFIYYCCYLSN